MSEFDNNGYETVETVENVETVDNGYEQTYQEAPNYNYDDAVEYQAGGLPGAPKVFAIISLVCGILSVLCSCCGRWTLMVAVAAVVLGIISLVKHESGKGMAIAGIACGGVGLIVCIVVIVVGAAALSSVSPEGVEEFIEQFETL